MGKKGMFGPLVIGEEQFKREQEELARGEDMFGPLVIGPSEPQKPTPEQLRAQPGLAALHGLAPAPAPGAPAAPPAKAPTSQLSLEKLTEALTDNPFILDSVIAAEFEREEGPRKAALRLFVKEENKKAEPRMELLQRLGEALKPTTTATA